MPTAGAPSVSVGPGGPERVNGRVDPGRRRWSRPDLSVLYRTIDRLAPAAPVTAAASLLALAASEMLEIPEPIRFVLLAIAGGAILVILSEEHILRFELRRARVNAADAIDIERQRIQHDLHDGVQQRLVSVRIRLDDLSRSSRRDEVRQVVEGLGSDLDAALYEIRGVTFGSSPPLLVQRGLSAALRAAAAYSPMRVSLDAPVARRYSPEVERCVYFCVLEALQNVIKHAGRSARAWIKVTERPDRLVFEVEDSGVGFDLGSTRPGHGLASLVDRVGALGGRLGIDTRPGFGTRVRGEIPLDGQSRAAVRTRS
jgi:signal transduction histidine kinase